MDVMELPRVARVTVETTRLNGMELESCCRIAKTGDMSNRELHVNGDGKIGALFACPKFVRRAHFRSMATRPSQDYSAKPKSCLSLSRLDRKWKCGQLGFLDKMPSRPHSAAPRLVSTTPKRRFGFWKLEQRVKVSWGGMPTRAAEPSRVPQTTTTSTTRRLIPRPPC